MTKEWYRLELFKHGILATLYALEEFERLEMYEECEKIKLSIEDQNEKLECGFDTRLTEKMFQVAIDTWNKDKEVGHKKFTEKEIKNAYKYYSEIIIKEVLHDYSSSNV